jgi:hypothetical protein
MKQCVESCLLCYKTIISILEIWDRDGSQEAENVAQKLIVDKLRAIYSLRNKVFSVFFTPLCRLIVAMVVARGFTSRYKVIKNRCMKIIEVLDLPEDEKARMLRGL